MEGIPTNGNPEHNESADDAMSARTWIGVFGGRFDPIHLCHLAIAEIAHQTLGLDRILVVPSRMSPHRSAPAGATDVDRLAMVQVATTDHPYLMACELELRSSAPSYTAITLRRIREHYAGSQLCFIIGADAFAEIGTWHDYPDVLHDAHFAVVSRPGHPVSSLVDTLPSLRTRMHEIPPGELTPTLHNQESTKIFLIDAVTPNVSSTGLRARLASHESLSGLVSAPVESYIAQHQLYTSPSRGKQLA